MFHLTAEGKVPKTVLRHEEHCSVGAGFGGIHQNATLNLSGIRTVATLSKSTV